MKHTLSLYQSTSGQRLARRDFSPDTPPIGGAVLIHGLGDHTGRYGNIAPIFTDHGLFLTGTDLPGHGHSPGERGHIESLEDVFRIINENIFYVRSQIPKGAPVGLIGYSMGGFFSLFYLATRPSICDFSWITSTLVNPAANKSKLLQWFVRASSFLGGRVCVDSGVSAEKCRRGENGVPPQHDALSHQVISAGLGSQILRYAEVLDDIILNISPNLNLLMTHGGKDEICPPEYAQELFNQLPQGRKRFELYPEALHEPHRDITKNEVILSVRQWLNTQGFQGPMPTFEAA